VEQNKIEIMSYKNTFLLCIETAMGKNMTIYKVLIRSTKEDKEYTLNEDDYKMFKQLPYKRAMNFLKELDKQKLLSPTE